MKKSLLAACLAVCAPALAGDLYVSASGLHAVEGSDAPWGTYVTEDDVAHDAYTDLQQAINAAAANDTIWVEDGFVCDAGVVSTSIGDARIHVTKTLTIRGRSGSWENGPVIRGAYATAFDGTEKTRCGEGAVRCAVFSNNNGPKLVGFRLENGATVVSGTSHSNQGGGVYSGKLENCLVTGCAASEGGGAYSANLTDCVVSNCSAVSTSVNAYGGGVYGGTLSNCLVTMCHASYMGGGISGSTTYDCIVENCVADSYGGCIRSGTHYRPVLRGGRANEGSAIYQGSLYGGVISNCLVKSTAASCARLDGVLLTGNAGSHLFNCSNNGLIATNCVATGNSTTYIIVSDRAHTGLIVDCAFTNNASAVSVYIGNMTRPCNLNFLRCVIDGDTAIRTLPSSKDPSVLQTCRAESCVFRGRLEGTGDYYNCLVTGIAGTKAADLSPVSCTAAQTSGDAPLNLYNCTVTGNVRSPREAGAGGGNVRAYNSIIRGNTRTSASADAFAVATNCCLEDDAEVATGAGCVRADPCLVYVGGLPFPADYSPCLATGSTAAYALTEKDLAGRPRATAAGGAETVSMGACEHDPELLAANIVRAADSQYEYAPATGRLTAYCTGLGSGPLTYYWDFDGDGAVDLVATSPSSAYAFALPGVYAPSVAVSNAVAGVAAALPPIAVGARPIHYVVEGSATPAAPYATIATAAASIAAAVDCAADGDEVVILPGTYAIDTQIVVRADIAVHGSTGRPEDVVVHQTSYDRCFQINGGPACIVHSLTVENGGRNESYEVGSGVFIGFGGTIGANYAPTAAQGTLSNVIVRSCHQGTAWGGYGSNLAKYARGTGVFAIGPGALVTHCVITNNFSTSCYSAGGRGNGVGLHLADHARAEHCLVARNFTGSTAPTPSTGNLWEKKPYGMSHAAVWVEGGAVLRFSTVAGNAMSFCGGVNVLNGGRFENCVVAGNRVLYASVADADDRYKVWASFPAAYASVYSSSGDSAAFDAYIAAEKERAEDAACRALLAMNAVDAEDAGLGAGTVEAEAARLLADAEAGDYRLPRRSPAIDAIPRAAVAPPVGADLLGNTRPFGAGYDPGCFEAQYPLGFIFSVR